MSKRQRIDRNTGVPVRPSMYRRMNEMRRELGKSITKTHDDHMDALQSMWNTHATINQLNS